MSKARFFLIIRPSTSYLTLSGALLFNVWHYGGREMAQKRSDYYTILYFS